MNIELNDEQRVKIFNALADSNRLEMIRYLNQVKREVTVEELGQCLQVSPSTQSYHGKILKDASLTTTRKDGRSKLIRLNEPMFDAYLPGFLTTL